MRFAPIFKWGQSIKKSGQKPTLCARVLPRFPVS